MSHCRPGDIVSRRKGLVMHKGVVLSDGNILQQHARFVESTSAHREFRAGQRLYRHAASY